jgi:hypothetical protein
MVLIVSKARLLNAEKEQQEKELIQAKEIEKA